MGSKRFIRNHGSIKPLSNMLKEGHFKWKDAAVRAFEELKDKITIVPILTLPNFNEQFVVKTDVS